LGADSYDASSVNTYQIALFLILTPSRSAETYKRIFGLFETLTMGDIAYTISTLVADRVV